MDYKGKHDRKRITDIKFYDACREIFACLKENDENKLVLDHTEAIDRKIYRRYVFPGNWIATSPIARLTRTGSIRRAPFLSLEKEEEFLQKYYDHDREQMYGLRQGESEDTSHKAK